MNTTTTPEHNEARGRAPRADSNRAERRRRKSSSLNRMASFKLDIFTPEQLDLENFVYRWVNDEDGRIRQATRMDDYDYVATDEISDFNPETTDSESTERIRMLVGRDKNGNPTYSYLLKKRRDYFEEDQDEGVRRREDMMAGIVHNAEVEALEGLSGAPGVDKATAEADALYAAKGNVIGSAAERRRGPISPRK